MGFIWPSNPNSLNFEKFYHFIKDLLDRHHYYFKSALKQLYCDFCIHYNKYKVYISQITNIIKKLNKNLWG